MTYCFNFQYVFFSLIVKVVFFSLAKWKSKGWRRHTWHMSHLRITDPFVLFLKCHCFFWYSYTWMSDFPHWQPRKMIWKTKANDKLWRFMIAIAAHLSSPSPSGLKTWERRMGKWVSVGAPFSYTYCRENPGTSCVLWLQQDSWLIMALLIPPVFAACVQMGLWSIHLQRQMEILLQGSWGDRFTTPCKDTVFRSTHDRPWRVDYIHHMAEWLKMLCTRKLRAQDSCKGVAKTNKELTARNSSGTCLLYAYPRILLSAWAQLSSLAWRLQLFFRKHQDKAHSGKQWTQSPDWGSAVLPFHKTRCILTCVEGICINIAKIKEKKKKGLQQTSNLLYVHQLQVSTCYLQGFTLLTVMFTILMIQISIALGPLVVLAVRGQEDSNASLSICLSVCLFICVLIEVWPHVYLLVRTYFTELL